MGKPVQISKCQLRINTFQLRSMQAAAGCGGHTCFVKPSIPIGVWSHHAHSIHKNITQWKHLTMEQLAIEKKMEPKSRLWDQSQYQMEKTEKPPVFCVYLLIKVVTPKIKAPFVTASKSSTTLVIPTVSMMMTAGCLSSLLHQHTCHYCHRWWVICASLVQQTLPDLFWPIS